MFYSNLFYQLIRILNIFDQTAINMGNPSPDFTYYAGLTLIITAVIELTFFLLKGVGILVLSRNNGVDNGWLGFIPFLSLYQLGRLIGPMSLFRVRFKNVGILVSIFAFVIFASSSVIDYFEYYDVFQTVLNANSFTPVLDSEGYLITNATTLTNVFSIIIDIFYIIYLIVYIFVIIAFFRLYSPRNSFVYSIVSIFFMDLFGVFVFAIRKNKKGSFYTFNPYNAYYGAPQNGNPNARTDGNKESPFNEYSNPSDNRFENVFDEYPDRKNGNNERNNGPFGNSNGNNSDYDDMF